MFTTRTTIALIRTANPDTRITEDQVRSFIRRGVVGTPTTVAGRYLWQLDEVLALAEALGLNPPTHKALQKEAVS